MGKKKNKNSNPSVRSQAKPVTKKEKKKQNALARAMLAAGATGANLLLPGAGGVVQSLGSAILDRLGLSEKVVLPEDFGTAPNEPGTLHMSGPIVASASAPVAFGRDEGLSSFLRVLHRASNGDVIVHVKEFLAEVGTAATNATFVNGTFAYSPWSPVDMPLLFSIANAYQYSRALMQKLHYVHYAPTSTQTRVSLGYSKDSGLTDSIALDLTFPEASRFSDFTVGSCYEDFALEVEPTSAVNWYRRPTVGTIAGEDTDVFQGTFFWSTDQNTVTNVQVGSVYLESIVAFKGTIPPDFGFTMLAALVQSKAPKELVAEVMYKYLSGKMTRERFKQWFTEQFPRLGVRYKPQKSTLVEVAGLPGAGEARRL